MTKCDCIRCGKCCIVWAYDISANCSDIKRWVKAGRKDILKHFLVGFLSFPHRVWGDEIEDDEYFDFMLNSTLLRRNGEHYKVCPFLIKKTKTSPAICKIHDTKPTKCSDYKPWEYKRSCPGLKRT